MPIRTLAGGHMSKKVVERLYADLAQSIRNGSLRPGDQFPTELTLSAQYEVARSSIREALKRLEQDGLLDLKWGRGRFVSASARLHVDRSITKLESVTELLQAQGLSATTKVIGVDVTRPTREEARALKIRITKKIIRLQRLRLCDDVPLLYSVDTLEASLFPRSVTEAEWGGSLFDLLSAAGHTPVTSIARFSAALTPPGIQEFARDDSAAWLVAVETCFSGSGSPILYSQTYYRGDQFSFSVLRRRSD